jgi:hypothetical protein
MCLTQARIEHHRFKFQPVCYSGLFGMEPSLRRGLGKSDSGGDSPRIKTPIGSRLVTSFYIEQQDLVVVCEKN